MLKGSIYRTPLLVHCFRFFLMCWSQIWLIVLCPIYFNIMWAAAIIGKAHNVYLVIYCFLLRQYYTLKVLLVWLLDWCPLLVLSFFYYLHFCFISLFSACMWMSLSSSFCALFSILFHPPLYFCSSCFCSIMSSKNRDFTVCYCPISSIWVLSCWILTELDFSV